MDAEGQAMRDPCSGVPVMRNPALSKELPGYIRRPGLHGFYVV